MVEKRIWICSIHNNKAVQSPFLQQGKNTPAECIRSSITITAVFIGNHSASNHRIWKNDNDIATTTANANGSEGARWGDANYFCFFVSSVQLNLYLHMYLLQL